MIKISLIIFFLLLLPSCFSSKKIVENQLIQEKEVIPNVILEEKDPKKLNALPASTETKPVKSFVDTVEDLPKVNNSSINQKKIAENPNISSNFNKNVTGSVIDDDVKTTNNTTSFYPSTSSTSNSFVPSVPIVNPVPPVITTPQPIVSQTTQQNNNLVPVPVQTQIPIPTNTDKSKLIGKIK